VIAIDTNILVRFLTRDDKSQHARAEKIFRNESVFIPDTVLLETEWVLRFSYEYAPARITASFRKLLGLPNVTIANPEQIAMAIDWQETGLDFADALHLAASRHCESFATFDTALIKKAKGLAKCKVRQP